MKLILLAHQDDEIFMLPFIDCPDPKLIIYLTSGVSRKAGIKEKFERHYESKNIYDKLLKRHNIRIVWWGFTHSQPEGELHNFTSKFQINNLIRESKLYSDKFTEIITTTFEGAHHDHDSCAYIARKIGEELGIPLIEVATYPQKFQRIYSFQVLKPLFPAGSKITFNRISVVKLAINLIWSYKTQRRTWMGLGILTIYNYLFKTFRVAIPQTIQHSTQCFYEFRGRAKQSDVLKKLR